jgi:hypothetical protein
MNNLQEGQGVLRDMFVKIVLMMCVENTTRTNTIFERNKEDQSLYSNYIVVVTSDRLNGQNTNAKVCSSHCHE